MFWESIIFLLCFYHSFLGIPCWPSWQAGCSPGWTFADPAQLFYVSIEYLLWRTCTALWILHISSYLGEAQVLHHLAAFTILWVLSWCFLIQLNRGNVAQVPLQMWEFHSLTTKLSVETNSGCDLLYENSYLSKARFSLYPIVRR